MAFITDLKVSLNGDEEKKLINQGFQQISSDLNEGVTGANSIYLWYKKGDMAPITRIQVSFNEKMAVGLTGYNKIDKNLNAGTSGKPLYMWFSKATGEFDVPITDIAVTVNPNSEVAQLMAGWEQVSCDLNLGTGGKFVYAWLKRERPIYICTVTATKTYDRDQELFSKGYTRVDVNTNMGAKEGAEVFLWYRKTTKEKLGLSALHISTIPVQVEDLEKKGFTMVLVNLNENTTENQVNLWFKQDTNSSRVKGLVLLRNTSAAEIYRGEGVTIVPRNLNTSNQGDIIYMCYV